MNLRKLNISILKMCTILVISFLSTFSSCTKDVSVSPPDMPPPNGYLFINSYPTGFQIYLNGLPRRRVTPDSLTWLSTNSYTITLKKNLFRDTSFSIDIVEGKKKDIFIDFSKNPAMLGSINLTSTPSKASVFINDSNTSKITPVVLTGLFPGIYYIKFHIANHRDDSVLVSVSSGTVVSAQKTLVDTTLWQDYTTANSNITTNQLTCIATDKNNEIWIGTPGLGLMKFDGTNWSNLIDNTPASAAHDTINCITIDDNNHIWAGTEFGGVLDVSGSSIRQYGFMSSGLPDFRIKSIAADNNGNVYLGTPAGLCRTWIDNTGNRNWHTYTTNELSFLQYDSWITALAVDANQVVWIGLESAGIGNSTGKLYESSHSSIINNNITALAASGIEVWAGHAAGQVFGTGLSYFDGANWQKLYPLPIQSFAQTIFIDHLGNKWIGTNKEVVKLSGLTTATVFDYSTTGLNLTDIRGITEDQSGNIWIATYGGGLIKYKGNH